MLIKEEAVGTAWTGDEYGVQRSFQMIKKITGLNGKIVFDIGCGAGGYSLATAKSRAKYVVSVDIAAERIRMAKALRKLL